MKNSKTHKKEIRIALEKESERRHKTIIKKLQELNELYAKNPAGDVPEFLKKFDEIQKRTVQSTLILP